MPDFTPYWSDWGKTPPNTDSTATKSIPGTPYHHPIATLSTIVVLIFGAIFFVVMMRRQRQDWREQREEDERERERKNLANNLSSHA